MAQRVDRKLLSWLHGQDARHIASKPHCIDDAKKRGNQQLYSADTTCPVYPELASILRKTSGAAEVLAQSLAPVASELRAAFVFGSVAQGRETVGSDIDLMLIGDIGFRQAVELTHPAQAVLGREINPRVFSASEFTARAATEPFLCDVLAKPKIFLIGDDHDLAELAECGSWPLCTRRGASSRSANCGTARDLAKRTR